MTCNNATRYKKLFENEHFVFEPP